MLQAVNVDTVNYMDTEETPTDAYNDEFGDHIEAAQGSSTAVSFKRPANMEKITRPSSSSSVPSLASSDISHSNSSSEAPPTPRKSQLISGGSRMGVETSPRPAKSRRASVDPELQQYEDLLGKLVKLEKEVGYKDCNDTFGEYVAQELKKMSPLQQAIMKKDIVNLITVAEINRLSESDPSISIQIVPSEGTST